MISDSNTEEKSGGIKRSWKILLFLIKVIFPAYALIQMNNGLNKAGRFYKNPWFPNQIKKNTIAFVLLSSMFLGPVLLGGRAITKNVEFSRKLDQAKKSVASFDIKNARENLGLALSDKKLVKTFEIFGTMALFGLFFGNFIVFYAHDLVRNTKKLTKVLKNEGVIDRKIANPLAIWTPIGVLMDLSGSAPKEIAVNERIWMAMNIQVKDWAEDPDKRSLVFFKTTFKLQSRYDYLLPKDFK